MRGWNGALAAVLLMVCGGAEAPRARREARPEHTPEGNPRNSPFNLALHAGQPRTALSELRRAVADNPDDADLHAWAGIANARIGRFAEAVTAFRLALGGAVYEAEGVPAHADALRHTGDPLGAAGLRSSWIEVQPSGEPVLTQRVGLVDDLRWAGAEDRAWDAAWELIAVAPGAAVGWEVLAEVALDLDRPDEAEEALYFASLAGPETLRGRLARARLALGTGDAEEAYALLQGVPSGQRAHRPHAMRAEILRRSGQAAGALAVLESRRLPDKERPEMLAAMIAAYAQAGELDNARLAAGKASRWYPADPDVRNALRVLAQAEASPPPRLPRPSTRRDPDAAAKALPSALPLAAPLSPAEGRGKRRRRMR